MSMQLVGFGEDVPIIDDDNKVVPPWFPVIEVDLNELLYTCCFKKECTRYKCATRGELCLPFCKCPCNNVDLLIIRLNICDILLSDYEHISCIVLVF